MQRPHARCAGGQDDVGRERKQFRDVGAEEAGIAGAPVRVDLHVATLAPAQLREPLQECRVPRPSFAIVSRAHEHADAPHAVGLLRARPQRPRGCRAAEKGDELAALDLRDHSITSSARASSLSGIVSPSALAVVWLMINSNFVGF